MNPSQPIADKVPARPFDLDAYMTRIGYAAVRTPDRATLAAVHRAHVASIPFENLDIQLGRPIRLDPDAIQAKLVGQRRGGYCFEQNRLLAMALEALGFSVETCEARVGLRADRHVRPRTHMVLRVAVDDHLWLADVGFGGDGLVEPLAMDGRVVEQCLSAYRVVSEGSLAVLQRRRGRDWDDLYAVLPDPVHPVDFEVGNWFTSTFPKSPFVLNLTAQRIVDDERHILRNLAYSVARGDRVVVREIAECELVPLLRNTFGLDVPDGVGFRAIDHQRQQTAGA